MKKILFTCILFLGLTITGFAQSEKMKEKANEKIEKLNAQITQIDKSLALTEAQKEEILAIEIEKLKKIKTLRKETEDKAVLKTKIKALNKEAGKNVSENVLSKPQKKARKEARSKTKK